jgi:hypothetical protein
LSQKLVLNSAVGCLFYKKDPTLFLYELFNEQKNITGDIRCIRDYERLIVTFTDPVSCTEFAVGTHSACGKL